MRWLIPFAVAEGEHGVGKVGIIAVYFVWNYANDGSFDRKIRWVCYRWQTLDANTHRTVCEARQAYAGYTEPQRRLHTKLDIRKLPKQAMVQGKLARG